MRTFIALEVPERFRWELAGFARRLEGAVSGRFIEPDNYHVTLAFLGDVGTRDMEAAVGALEAAGAGCEPVLLRSDGLGKFGNAGDATLWLGLAQTEPLESLAAAMREELVARDVTFDPKPFKAHITIARRACIPKRALPALPFPEPDYASTVTLFKSELDSSGATYTALQSIELCGATNL